MTDIETVNFMTKEIIAAMKKDKCSIRISINHSSILESSCIFHIDDPIDKLFLNDIAIALMDYEAQMKQKIEEKNINCFR